MFDVTILQADLEEDRLKELRENRTKNEKIKLYLKRAVFWFLVLAIYGASLYGIYLAAEKSLSVSFQIVLFLYSYLE